ncbi:MAG: peroxiredoxin-like family protein [Opitutales bacterium]
MKMNFVHILASLSFLLTVSLSAIPSDATEVNPVEVASTAPNVTLTTADGAQVKLHQLVSEHPAVLVFYRGGWCPYCNRHLAALGEIEDELRALGYRIHAISPDKPAKVKKAAAETDLSYTLYSDAPADAAKAFGLAFQVDTPTYERLLGFGIDLEAASGQKHHILPVPAVFLIGRDAKIDFRYYNPDYKERLSGEALLKAARAD